MRDEQVGEGFMHFRSHEEYMALGARCEDIAHSTQVTCAPASRVLVVDLLELEHFKRAVDRDQLRQQRPLDDPNGACHSSRLEKPCC